MKNNHMWSPASWEKHEVTQGVIYPNADELSQVITQLNDAPPLITKREIKDLKQLICNAEKGEAFILQAGDCSELFSECHQTQIINKLKILLQMSLILNHSLKKPIIRIGRIAGQYAKPRTALEETLNGVTLPTYRGDMINDYDFTLEARLPNPQRMLKAYHFSGLTLNYLRALTKVEFFTSHEALHLPYEAALTREVETDHFYNLSTHFPWIGMRTLHKNSAHMEYLRGIENPIGIKVGPDVNFDELNEFISILNPTNESGKIVLIHRFGKNNIAKKLPVLLETISQAKKACTIICDPMHGNTYTTKQGIKTRYFGDILEELQIAFSIHHTSSLPLAGIHFEVTGENVTECVGGACGLQEEDLTKTYTSLVDPRLNYSQALEMILKVAEWHEEL